MTKDDSTVYVGADISWSVDPGPKSTGLSTIENGALVDFQLVGTDEEIVEYAVNQNADFIGVDAPLKVPNEDGQRPVESELRKSGYSVYPANRNWFNRGFGGVRGERLVERLVEAGYELSVDTSTSPAVIEVFPRPTIKAILGEVPQYKNATKSEIYHGLESLWTGTKANVDEVDFRQYTDLIPDDLTAVTKADLKGVGDQIDGFYSAFVLKLDYENRDRTMVYGDLQTGSILTAI